MGLSWRCDETYIKVAGAWTYLYRAVDQHGKTVDFFLSKRRDVRAAKPLFRHALRKHGDPLSITLDAYAASHRAVQELKDSGEIFYQKMRVRSCAGCVANRFRIQGSSGTVKRMRERRPALFRGRHFQDEIIVLCVRWYLRYPLSYRDLEEMMAERGLAVDHSTIARWVLHFAPILNERIRREMRHPKSILARR